MECDKLRIILYSQFFFVNMKKRDRNNPVVNKKIEPCRTHLFIDCVTLLFLDGVALLFIHCAALLLVDGVALLLVDRVALLLLHGPALPLLHRVALLLVHRLALLLVLRPARRRSCSPVAPRRRHTFVDKSCSMSTRKIPNPL